MCKFEYEKINEENKIYNNNIYSNNFQLFM